MAHAHAPALAAPLALLLAALLLAAQVSPSDARSPKRRNRGRGLRETSEKPESTGASETSPSDVEAVTAQAAAAPAAASGDTVTISAARSASPADAGGGEQAEAEAPAAESVADADTARAAGATATSAAIADATSSVSYVDSSSEAEAASGANAHARAEGAAPAAAPSAGEPLAAPQGADGGAAAAAGSRDATGVLGHGDSFDTAKSAGLADAGPPVLANANAVSAPAPIDLQHTAGNQFSLSKRPPGLAFPAAPAAHGIHGHALHNVIAPVDCSQDPGTTTLKISCTPNGPMLPRNPYFYEKPILLKGPRHTFLAFKSKLHTPTDDAYALPFATADYDSGYASLPLDMEPAIAPPVQSSGYANELTNFELRSPLYMIPPPMNLPTPTSQAYLTYYVPEAPPVLETPVVPEPRPLPPLPVPEHAPAAATAPGGGLPKEPSPPPAAAVSNTNVLAVRPPPARPSSYCSQGSGGYGVANPYDFSGELSAEEPPPSPIQEPPPMFAPLPPPPPRPVIANANAVASRPHGQSVANANAVSLPNPNPWYGPLPRPHAGVANANAGRPNYEGGFSGVSIANANAMDRGHAAGYKESIANANAMDTYGALLGGNVFNPFASGFVSGENYKERLRNTLTSTLQGAVANANAISNAGVQYRPHITNANAVGHLFPQDTSGSITNANTLGHSTGFREESVVNSNTVNSVKGQQNPYTLGSEDYDYEYDTLPPAANLNVLKGKRDRYPLDNIQGSGYGGGIANSNAFGLRGSYGYGGAVGNANAGSGYPVTGQAGGGSFVDANAFGSAGGYGYNANGNGEGGYGGGQDGSVSNINLLTKGGHGGEGVGNSNSLLVASPVPGYPGAISNANALGGGGYASGFGGSPPNAMGGGALGGNVNDGAGISYTSSLGGGGYGNVANSNAYGGGSYEGGAGDFNSVGSAGYGSGVSSANAEEGSISNSFSDASGYGSNIANVLGLGLYGMNIANANAVVGGNSGFGGSIASAHSAQDNIANANAVSASSTIHFGRGQHIRNKRSISLAEDDFGSAIQDTNIKADAFKPAVNHAHKIHVKKSAMGFGDAARKNFQYLEVNSLDDAPPFKDPTLAFQFLQRHHMPHHIRHQAALRQLEMASKDAAPAVPSASSKFALALAATPREEPYRRPPALAPTPAPAA